MKVFGVLAFCVTFSWAMESVSFDSESEHHSDMGEMQMYLSGSENDHIPNLDSDSVESSSSEEDAPYFTSRQDDFSNRLTEYLLPLFGTTELSTVIVLLQGLVRFIAEASRACDNKDFVSKCIPRANSDLAQLIYPTLPINMLCSLLVFGLGILQPANPSFFSTGSFTHRQTFVDSLFRCFGGAVLGGKLLASILTLMLLPTGIASNWRYDDLHDKLVVYLALFMVGELFLAGSVAAYRKLRI